ncbi:MAG TPA: lipopolysaccharide transport periplasmic protein LptA [Casimicrobiaceae bacterium]
MSGKYDTGCAPVTIRAWFVARVSVAALVLFAALALGAAPARAEKADRDKPINFSAEQPAQVDFQKRVGTLRGNVIITQGTLAIHADRIDFKQNPDNSLSATAYGNPVSFRQKKDGSDEYFEGYAQKAVYNGETQTLELFDRALLKQGSDEIRSNYISYNSATGIFRAEGRPDAAGAEGPGARVRGVFQPRPEDSATKGPTAPGAPAAPGATASGKPAAATAPSAPATGGGTQATPAGSAAPAPPLTLTPDTRPPAR